MKISQKKTKFNPVTITLETEQEACAFLSIVDTCDRNIFGPDSNEGELLKSLSDSVTNRIVYIP